MRRLALGTVQFGLDYGIANSHGQVTPELASQMLDLASNKGINLLDTAIAYGESESRLGQVGVEKFDIVTKLPAIPEGCGNVGAWVEDQLARSLRRLGVKSLYGLLLHRPGQLLGPYGTELISVLRMLKLRGMVRKLGVSIYSPEELSRLVENFPVDIVQAPLNVIDRRLYTSGWLRQLHLEGVEIHARSCFLQGLLLMKQFEIPQYFAPWKNLFENWHNWLRIEGISAVQGCLSYSLSHMEVNRVVVGADNMAQLLEIAGINDLRSGTTFVFPEVASEDESLINPVKWNNL